MKEKNQNRPIKKICRLFDSFVWFEKELGSQLTQACVNFWETNLKTKLYSITESDSIKDDFITRYDSFFTHKVRLELNQVIKVRFSSEFVRDFLNDSLGECNGDFSLFDLTDLEVRILNSFAKFIVKNFEPYFNNKKQHAPIIQNSGNYNLTFLAQKEHSDVSKITVSIPKNLISSKITIKTPNFTNDDFLHVPILTDWNFGHTKIPLNSLKNLNEGDYIVFENSNIKNMLVKIDNMEQLANIKPNLALVEDLPESNNSSEGDDMTKNIWDDIQVDVSAEFQKIKMTLGELKQISNGVVIDIDDVFKGKINLVVENKIVAKGDLVIINDRYGVRVDEVIPSEQAQNQAQAIQEPKIKPIGQTPPRPQTQPQPQQQAPRPQAAAPQNQPQPQPQQQAPRPQAEAQETENFDYSNFEDDGDHQ